MAKIIDFKTRQVLAELPNEVTSKVVQPFKVSGALQGKIAIIADNHFVAEMILVLIKNALLDSNDGDDSLIA